MHVPGGSSPYYQNPGAAVVTGGMHYPPGAYVSHGPVEDGVEPEYRGGGGRGSARGGGGRGGRRNGRKNGRGNGGRGSYHTNHNLQHGGGSGRRTPQNVGSEVNSAPSTGERLDSVKGENAGGARENGNEASGGESNGADTANRYV